MFNNIKKFLEGLRRSFGRTSEDFFLKGIARDKVPLHVAIVMDGNGRWAAQRGLPRLVGHRAGANAIREVVSLAPEIGVKYLTLYTFSIENWRRPEEEIKGLMSLIDEMLQREVGELHQKGVKVNVIGRLSQMPNFIQRSFQDAMELTKNNQSLTLNIALNYGGRAEIIDAVKEICRVIKEKSLNPELIDEETLAKYLYTANIPDPELFIRTSGELRISNFLLWQIAYSELYVTPVLWPDFKRKDFLEAIYVFQQRKRRYGGLEED